MTREEKRIREREVGVRVLVLVLGLGLVVSARVVGFADVDLDVGDLGGRGRLGFRFLDDGWTG